MKQSANLKLSSVILCAALFIIGSAIAPKGFGQSAPPLSVFVQSGLRYPDMSYAHYQNYMGFIARVFVTNVSSEVQTFNVGTRIEVAYLGGDQSVIGHMQFSETPGSVPGQPPSSISNLSLAPGETGEYLVAVSGFLSVSADTVGSALNVWGEIMVASSFSVSGFTTQGSTYDNSQTPLTQTPDAPAPSAPPPSAPPLTPQATPMPGGNPGTGGVQSATWGYDNTFGSYFSIAGPEILSEINTAVNSGTRPAVLN